MYVAFLPPFKSTLHYYTPARNLLVIKHITKLTAPLITNYYTATLRSHLLKGCFFKLLKIDMRKRAELLATRFKETAIPIPTLYKKILQYC